LKSDEILVPSIRDFWVIIAAAGAAVTEEMYFIFNF
jgi:hypothetical protein